MEVSKREHAPGELEAVRAFVNTRHLEDETDEIATPAALRDWLAARGVLDAEVRPGPAAVRRAHELREALRDLIEADMLGTERPDAARVLDGAARRARLTIGFAPGGEARIEPRAAGVDGALGRLVARVAHAKAVGTWARLKTCHNPGCRWAFYDHTKNHAGRWCSMASCGNRAKAHAYRERRAASGGGNG